MGSTWGFTRKLGGTIKSANDAVQLVIALVPIGLAIVAGWQFGLPWGVASFFVALAGVLFVTGVRVQHELDANQQPSAAATGPVGPLAGSMWIQPHMEHFGALVNTGSETPGTFPMTPGLMELQHRRDILNVLLKMYAATAEGTKRPSWPVTPIPREWADARLAELGETWRLGVYSADVSARDLMC